MAKTTVSTLTSDIKALVDYDITDTNLDALILKALNFDVNRMQQWFYNEGLFDEIGAHDSFNTTADQEYVNIATETVDFDQLVILTERTNDNPIEIVPFEVYRALYPDPTADKSQTPDVAAFFANRLYLGPTPSAAITLYLDYVRLITKLTSASSLPYEDKYDELVVAIVVEHLVKWLDRGDVAAIKIAKDDILTLKHDLIVAAAKNTGGRQVQSRRSNVPYF